MKPHNHIDMKKTTLSIICTLVIALMPVSGFAQSDDFGIWASVGAEKKLGKKWAVGLEAEMRTRDDVGTMDRWSVGVGGTYKVTSWLKAGAGYDLLFDNNEKYSYHDDGTPNKRAKYWGTRHRFYVQLTGGVDLGRFNLSLRERWQYTYRPEKTVSERYDYDQEDYDGEEKTYRGKGKNVLRSRLTAKYDIRHCPVTPFASAEIYNAWNLQKTRYTVGAEWKISKQHSVELYYRYQDVNNDDEDNEGNSHILGVGYQFKF